VHTNSSKAGILGRLAARRASVPRVLHSVHGWPFHEGQSAVASAVWTQLERRTARFAERLVVVADVDRQKGLNAGIGRPEQYRTVRSGLELDQYVADQRARMEVRDELGIPASAFVIGSVCRLSPQKDPLLLLEGALPVLRAHSDARLLLVGDGPLRGAVESVVLGSGVADQVLLTGLRRDVPRLLNAMDLFVLSSRWEGLPRTLIQAMATGVPVVATDADGVREVVVDGVTGWLVSRGSAAGLAAAVRQAIAEPERRRAMASAAGARLPEFDAVTMVRQLESLYIGHE
jgi:glycosyltransferase involved in cell wall biosynthesis